MDRDALRRSSKAAALASLHNLSAAFAGDTGAVEAISHMIKSIQGLHIKPNVPASGEATAVAHSPEEAVEREHKRPRRQSAKESMTIDSFPVGCEVLLPRTDDSGNHWNDYSRVVGHTANGQLLLQVPNPAEDEEPVLQRSIFSLGSQLGSEETRPLKRSGSSSSASGVGASVKAEPVTLPPAAGPVAPSPPPAASMALPPAAAPMVVTPPAAAPVAPPPAAVEPVAPPEEDKRPADKQLANSRLRLSSGRTREQLNQHLSTLGLAAKFGQSVVSALQGGVSQLTFNIGEWNDLPPDEHHPYVWWLGEGAKRLQLAELVHPELREQPARGVPLFFAVKRAKGGALCYYGGHYTTHSFVVLQDDKRINFKERDRQARIEFQFVHFDEILAAAIEAIPDADAPNGVCPAHVRKSLHLLKRP